MISDLNRKGKKLEQDAKDQNHIIITRSRIRNRVFRMSCFEVLSERYIISNLSLTTSIIELLRRHKQKKTTEQRIPCKPDRNTSMLLHEMQSVNHDERLLAEKRKRKEKNKMRPQLGKEENKKRETTRRRRKGRNEK